MSCPGPEQLAAAATGEDDAILFHVAACRQCQELLDHQRAVRALVGAAPVGRLLPARREALAAEVMARADQLPATARRRRTWPWLATASTAAAAVIAIAVVRDGPSSTRPARVPSEAAPSTVPPASEHTVCSPAPRTGAHGQPSDPPGRADARDRGSDSVGLRAATGRAPVRPSATGRTERARATVGGGEYARDTSGDHDVVRLRDGALTVDALETHPVRVVAGDTAVAVSRARVQVIARKGVIAQVSVFAGSAEIMLDSHPQVIEAGMVWERDEARQRLAVAREHALAAFRDGWTALRAGDHADAIAAFDRATDPVIAEDAAYWAAIAAERAGDPADAVRRYRDLIARFPGSPRALDAGEALARLAR